MYRSRLLCTAAALLFSASVIAHADTFTFTITGGASGSGTLTGTSDGNVADAFDITSATGNINGTSVFLATGSTGADSSGYMDVTFASPPPGGSFDVDDVIYLNGGNTSGNPGSAVDSRGILFQDSTGTIYNIYSVPPIPGPAGDVLVDSISYPVGPGITFTVTDTPSVPEPSSLALLGTGLLGTFGMLRRRFKA